MSEHDTCDLKHANGLHGAACTGEQCTYWRVAGHVGVTEQSSGCAIKYFSLLEDGTEIAAWLLSVKQRVEGE